MFTHKDDENLRLLYALSDRPNEMKEYWTNTSTFVLDYNSVKPPFILTEQCKQIGKDSPKSS